MLGILRESGILLHNHIYIKGSSCVGHHSEIIFSGCCSHTLSLNLECVVFCHLLITILRYVSGSNTLLNARYCFDICASDEGGRESWGTCLCVEV